MQNINQTKTLNIRHRNPCLWLCLRLCSVNIVGYNSEKPKTNYTRNLS